MNERLVMKAKARAKDIAALASAKSGPKKRASMGLNERVWKKACTAKFCQHCKTNGGPLHYLGAALKNFLNTKFAQMFFSLESCSY